MKKLIHLVLFLLFVASCSPVDPSVVPIDNNASYIKDINPSSEDEIMVSLFGYTNLSEYIKVSYVIVDMDGAKEKGTFKNFPTYRVCTPQTGTIKVALYAEQIQEFPESLLSSEDGVSFSVTSQIMTPHEGKSITWCDLLNSSVSSMDELTEKTINSLNTNDGEGLYGTGNTHYLQYEITTDEEERFVVKISLCKGNLFE